MRISILFLLCSALLAHPNDVQAQETPTPLSTAKAMKVLTVGPESKSGSVVAVPPSTSVVINSRGNGNSSRGDKVDLSAWLAKQTSSNGLPTNGQQAWHIVISYDQFDEDGDNVHSGVLEEFWAGESKYRRTYKTDNLNQTDYATGKGLFRVGDQKWPDAAQSEVRNEVVNPFFEALSLQGFHGKSLTRVFSGYELQCVLLERNQEISDPMQYCFEPGTWILRYKRGNYWHQTVYNQIDSFLGRNLARDLEVTDGGKKYLKLHVDTLELLKNVSDQDFAPPPDAMGPVGERISGIRPVLINMSSFPQWPTSLRGQHFVIDLDIVIGKDGRVISAHATSGPKEAQRACENAVRKWLFQPVVIAGKPVELEAKSQCRNN